MLQVNRRSYRSWVVILSLIIVVVLAACAGAVPAAPAQPAATEAPAVAVEATEAPAEEAAAEATEAPVEEVAEEATEEVNEEPAAEATEAPAEEAAAMGTVTFVIDPAQSEARFTLTEMLMGNHTTVVGRGNGVEGSVTVDFDDHSQSVISPIVIDATMLATDNNMRNGQIRRAILQTNNPEFQFITFTPTAVEGMPESVTVGEPFDLTVTGDLTIRSTTQPMTFEVTVTPISETELQGSARATLLRADFELQIPSVPSVADVSEEVLLEFDFVAQAQ
jgi:polyisoprenoid-binding protein YceI